MSKVFIIEPPRSNIDVSDARKFGDIVYVFNHDDRRCGVWQITLFGQTILKRLEFLKFNPETDYVCVTGAMLTVSIAIIVIAQCYDEFNTLLFNSVDNCYVEKRFRKNDWKGFQDGAKSRATVKSD